MRGLDSILGCDWGFGLVIGVGLCRRTGLALTFFAVVERCTTGALLIICRTVTFFFTGTNLLLCIPVK